MKLTLTTFLSLDGVMQGPGGPDEDRSGGFDRGGWLVPFADEDMGRIVGGWFAEADAFLLGRSTYGVFEPFWSQVTDPENIVATKLNQLRKYVVSTTLTDPTWNDTVVIADDVAAAVARIKEEPGRELQVHGSCALAHTLHDAGLIDEYRLVLFPVVVGDGKRLFPDGSVPASLSLVGSEVTGAGATALTLRPASRLLTGEFSVTDGKESSTVNA